MNKEKDKEKDMVYRFHYFVNKILEIVNFNDAILKQIKDESTEKWKKIKDQNLI